MILKWIIIMSLGTLSVLQYFIYNMYTTSHMHTWWLRWIEICIHSACALWTSSNSRKIIIFFIAIVNVKNFKWTSNRIWNTHIAHKHGFINWLLIKNIDKLQFRIKISIDLIIKFYIFDRSFLSESLIAYFVFIKLH